jgi:lipopolysaccharide heptosyltransferase II
VFQHLQIYEPRERRLVGLADLAIAPLAWARRVPDDRPVRRVLLLRLERIGDLLMILDAIADARAAWPEAEIDLVVGEWNASLARLIGGVTRVEIASAPWLARGSAAHAWPALIRLARSWRPREYDVVVNFEPDIRSNLLAWLTGAPRRFGYSTGGGGAFLTDAEPYDPSSHVAVNARRLVARASGRAATARSGSPARLALPADAIHRARAIVGTSRRPLIGVHPSGGRPSKQWHLDRFAQTANELAQTRGATIVLTGAAGDRPMVDDVKRGLTLPPDRVVDACGDRDLPELAALLGELDLLVSSDTGPMHLAAAVGTPVVALFGPSDPKRYGPLGAAQRVIRIDLPCSPCGQVRLPPERCRGRVPDCLDGIHPATVVAAAIELLDAHEAQGAARRDRVASRAT